MNKKSIARNSLAQIIMILTSVMIIFPLYFMTINSFKTREQYLVDPVGLPNPFTLQNYVDAFAGKDFLLWFANSLILSLGAVALTMIVGLFAGYAFAKMKFRGRDALFSLIIPLMSVPPVAMLIPLFRTVVKLGMVNTLGSVIFIYCGLCLPMTVYMIRNFLLSVPDAILEAARIDGANAFVMYWRIAMPLTKPAWMTLLLFAFQGIWSVTPSAGTIYSEELKTLPSVMSSITAGGTARAGAAMAITVIMMIPPITIYFISQSNVMETMSSAGMKE